jgi:uncharacterized membrane protein YgcG
MPWRKARTLRKRRGTWSPAWVATVCTVLVLGAPGLHAQRQLSWDALEVDARLDADGVLHVTEIQAMVFTGDWNGGERVFNIRPRQRLTFDRLDRLAATGPVTLVEDRRLDHVDDYALIDGVTLRWRSRLPSDRPFADTRLTYAMRYRLDGVLLRSGDRYLLDHDFAFPDRDGDIRRFALRLTVDPAWQPLQPIRETYGAGPIAPGDGFVLAIPFRYAGSGAPHALDTSRSLDVIAGVGAILGLTALGLAILFVRERSLGRFALVSARDVNRFWIEQHLLPHPAEVIGAAWDEGVGPEEVVALLARMTAEGKLESTAVGADSMTLRLVVDRQSLGGQERALVDGLFFDGRTETTTSDVKSHYRDEGFDPAKAIKPDLDMQVAALLPKGDAPTVWGWPGATLFVTGAALLGWSVYAQPAMREPAIAVAVLWAFVGVLLQFPGRIFRPQIHWGLRAAVFSVLPAVAVASGTAAFLWFVVGSGRLELTATMVVAIAALSLAVTNSAINSMKSRQNAAALAFRKKLAAGRAFFQQELTRPIPDLRDEWYPWILAFGLGKSVDRWTTSRPSAESPYRWQESSVSSRSGASGSGGGWTGGGGGRSGGAGASATWAAAASSMAVGVSAPTSSDSGGGGGSSSGGSSGGGGGGGW